MGKSKIRANNFKKCSFACMMVLFMTLNACKQGKIWTIQTDDTKLVLGLNTGKNLAILELSNPTNGWNWIESASPIQLLNRVDIDGKQYTPDWVFRGATVDNSFGTKFTARFTNESPALELKSEWWARPGRGPVRTVITITNFSDGNVVVYYQPSLNFNLASNDKTTHWYINTDAHFVDSIGLYRTPLSAGYTRNVETIGEKPNYFIPFLGLDVNSKHGMYLGVEWESATTSISCPTATTAIVEAAGLSKGFMYSIPKGMSFEVPPAFIGAYNGDMDDAGNSLRKYIWNYSMPAINRTDSTYPRVQWNGFIALGKKPYSWDPVQSKFNPWINEIAPLGFEEAMIDDCWVN